MWIIPMSVNSKLSSSEIVLFFLRRYYSFHFRRLYYTSYNTKCIRSLLLSANCKKRKLSELLEINWSPLKRDSRMQRVKLGLAKEYRTRTPRANARPPRKFTISCFEIEINRFVRCSINGTRCFRAVASISLRSVDREWERGGGKKMELGTVD